MCVESTFTFVLSSSPICLSLIIFFLSSAICLSLLFLSLNMPFTIFSTALIFPDLPQFLTIFAFSRLVAKCPNSSWPLKNENTAETQNSTLTQPTTIIRSNRFAINYKKPLRRPGVSPHPIFHLSHTGLSHPSPPHPTTCSYDLPPTITDTRHISSAPSSIPYTKTPCGERAQRQPGPNSRRGGSRPQEV